MLIAGGGQAGLSLAATLGRIGVDTLVVDRLPRVGDCWRTRYHSLALHNGTEVNHLPYMPFPLVVADVPAEGHARRLVRGLRMGDGDQFLDQHGVGRRLVRRSARPLERGRSQ